MNSQKIIFIVGPTCVGKSVVAVGLAKKMNSEIISADSMQIYRGMDIGTAKITKEEMQAIPHHMLDIVEVSQPMDVSLYRKQAVQIIKKILSQNKVPIIAGGSGLYVRSLADGLFEGVSCNPQFRKNLAALAEEKGNVALHETLERIDPEAAKRIKPNDRRRLIRALEMIEAEKKPLSQLRTQWQDESSQPLATPFHIYGLTLERSLLYERINHRVEQMFEQGLVAETERLLKKGLKSNPSALQAIGYKEAIELIEKQCTYEECVERVKQGTRHFAKRQWTWFRRDPRIEWLEIIPEQKVEEIIEILYNKIERIKRPH